MRSPVSPPPPLVLSQGPGWRPLNWLYLSRAKWGTKWLFMPPKDTIVIEMRMHKSSGIYRSLLDAFFFFFFFSEAGLADMICYRNNTST